MFFAFIFNPPHEKACRSEALRSRRDIGGFVSAVVVILNYDFERARNREPLADCTNAYLVLLHRDRNQNFQNLVFYAVISNNDFEQARNHTTSVIPECLYRESSF